MKDRVFEGPDVAAALLQAAATTGLAVEELRHVVLEPGALAAPGTPARPARIAVLLGGAVERQAARVRATREGDPRGPAADAADPEAALHGLVEALARASGLPLRARVEPGAEASVVHLEGGDAFLLEDEGAVLQALEHLLQRALGERLGGRLALDATGYRAARETRLQGQVREWAEEVRRSGRPRELPPMNAYDRRLVHLAMAGEPGVRSFSVGEGSRRRVTIAPAPEAP